MWFSLRSLNAISLFAKYPDKQYEVQWAIVVISISCALCIAVLAAWYFFSDDVPNRIDYWRMQREWFLAINHATHNWSVVWFNVSHFGDAMVVSPFFFLLFRVYPRLLVAAFAALPFAVVFSHLGKRLFAIPRPAAVLEDGSFFIVGQKLAGYTSLPSGHTVVIFVTVTIALAVCVPRITKKTDAIFLLFGYIVAAVTALSRVAVGAHWPLDLVIGAACGSLAGLGGVFLTQRYTVWQYWLKSRRLYYLLSGTMLLWLLVLMQEALTMPFHLAFSIWCAVFVCAIAAILLLHRVKTPLTFLP